MKALIHRGLVGGLFAVGIMTATARMMRQYSFKDKVVVISGGSRGLGLLMARRLAKEGAKLFLIARDQQELEKAKNELDMAGNTVAIRVCDVTSQSEVNDTAAFALEHLDALSIFLQSAERWRCRIFCLMQSVNLRCLDIQKVFEWNLLATKFTSRQCAPD
jgi:NAD(P)-dependent dehydrogenase (short-subunit alcohol dehydrogenase family)